MLFDALDILKHKNLSIQKNLYRKVSESQLRKKINNGKMPIL